ncbi:hypothetical protein IJ732_02510 [bacterium]|nr:hypothetical protein [bacterium]
MKNSQEIIDEKVKLVIWDLDNTFWQGTLAEGETPTPVKFRMDIVKNLAMRGIMNSICSKNDFEKAKKFLQDLEIWDYFIFPKIGFFPKGQAVKQILEETHFRAENTIFIDDEFANHREVAFYNPKIKTIKPEVIDRYIYNLVNQDEPDKKFTRLLQYKHLEKKYLAQQEFSSNREFLEKSNITVKFIPLSNTAIDRAHELLNRTNQLNFTKLRISKDDVKKLLNNKEIKTELIEVNDNFGNYGFAGIYTLDTKTNTLIHFAFSCRIMNMGVEQFVWEYLKFPNIKLNGETATKLKNENITNYIKIIDYNEKELFTEKDLLSKIVNPAAKPNVFATGACELSLPIAYMSKAMINLEYEYTDWNIQKNVRIGNVGTEYFRSIFEMSDEDKNFCKRYFYNFEKDDAFQTKMFEKDWDYAVFTFHDDAQWEIFEHKTKKYNLVLGWGVVMFISDAIGTQDKAKWFLERFNQKGQISRKRFHDNLLWIAGKMSPKTKIVLMTCPCLESFANSKQAKKLNNIIMYLGKKYPEKFAVADINNVIKNNCDVLENAYHFSAENTYKLYLSILETIMEHFPPKNPPLLDNTILKNRKVCVLGDNTFEVSNAYHILNFGNLTPSAIASFKNGDSFKNEIAEKLPKAKNITFQNFDDINKDEYYTIVADKYNYSEIKALLQEKGFELQKDFIFFDNNLSANVGDVYTANLELFKYKI